MVLIGLISDTHDDIEAARRAIRILKERGASVFFHLGDIVAPFTLKAIFEEKPRELVAIYGNNCGEKLGLKRVAEEYGGIILEPPHILEYNGLSILLVHGFGSPEKTLKIVMSLARSGDYDFVFYGHTHEPRVIREGDTLVVNPGEACGCLRGRKTVAIVDTESRRAEIIEV